MNVDRVLLAEPRGFCAGVEMAIKALTWMVKAFDEPVYCYHEIVHNKLIVERFEKLGVVFVDDIEEVPSGSPLMLSAHGSAPEVVEKADEVVSEVIEALSPVDGVHNVRHTLEDEYFPPPRNIRNLLSAIDSFARLGFAAPSENIKFADKEIDASDILQSLSSSS